MIETNRNEENHAKCMDHLAESIAAVWRVAKMLHMKGYNVTVPSMVKSPTYEERMEFADGGDLFIAQRIEVKERSFEFTKAGDFPYETAIVCAKHSFDNANPKPFAYVMLSGTRRFAGIIFVRETFSRWTVGKFKDSRYDKVEQYCYVCPKELVQFQAMPKP